MIASNDISKAMDLAMRYNEALFRSSSYEVHAWIHDGCDLTLDILPTITEIIERRHKNRIVSKIDNWKYFRGPVNDAKERRLAAERAEERKTPAPDDADAIHRKARMAARTVRVYCIKSAEAERFLASYEREYGPVS